MQFSLKPSDRDPLGQPVGLCIPQHSAPWPSYSRGGGAWGTQEVTDGTSLGN